jgi:threonyl-tRNA synthetase
MPGNLQSELQKMGLRVKLDNRNEKTGYKIRKPRCIKFPTLLCHWRKRAPRKTMIAVRRRDGKRLGGYAGG